MTGRPRFDVELGDLDPWVAQGQVRGARYTALADACPACRAEDTDELLALDDPRLVRPPHPGCEHPEGCRCILVYEMVGEEPADG